MQKFFYSKQNSNITIHVVLRYSFFFFSSLCLVDRKEKMPLFADVAFLVRYSSYVNMNILATYYVYVYIRIHLACVCDKLGA